MGVCPAGASAQPVMPPGTFGGNMDTRQLVRGATLYLPVQVEGALFSCGDAHAAQGDGEVCVTGIEAPMFASLRFTLEKGRSIPSPQFRTPAPLTRRVDTAPFYGTTGVGGDLYVAAQDAVRAMIDHLVGDLLAVPRGRLRALQPGGRPQDLRDRGRRRVHRQRPPARGSVPAALAVPDGATSVLVVADLFGISGRRDELRAVLATEERDAAARPGCVRYSFSPTLADPDHYILLAEWEDQAALDAHYASPGFANFQFALDGLLARPSEMTQYVVSGAARPLPSGPLDPRDAD